uniref:Transposase n=1 Tax=Ditylenchus dipsaci TaxID=166011 RepID=A0A915CYQ2_9BILA
MKYLIQQNMWTVIWYGMNGFPMKVGTEYGSGRCDKTFKDFLRFFIVESCQKQVSRTQPDSLKELKQRIHEFSTFYHSRCSIDLLIFMNVTYTNAFKAEALTHQGLMVRPADSGA